MTKVSQDIVLLKSHFDTYGGLEKYSWRIAQIFAKKNFLVKILTTGKITPHFSHPNISFHSFSPLSWPSFYRLENFDYLCQQWIKENPSKIIFGMDRNSFQTHLRAGNGSHLAYLHSRNKSDSFLHRSIRFFHPFHRKILSMEKKAFENSKLKKLITNSHMVKKQILHYYSIDPKKIVVIHNGVEWQEMEKSFFLWKEKKQNLLKKFSLPENVYHFLFIGNGFLRKGLKPLLQACSLIKHLPFHLTVVGKEKNFKNFIYLKNRLRLQEKVTFFSQRSDIISFYQYADSLVIPSFYDPFANVTVEALAMGLFVVSSKTNGGHEVLNEKNGVIIEDIYNIDSIKTSLEIAIKYPKTTLSAKNIRNNIKYLDFAHQLEKIVSITL